MRLRPLAIGVGIAAAIGGIAVYAWLGSVDRAERASLPGVPPQPLISADQVSQFVGSETCGSCHPNEHETHQHTTHATTLFVVEGSGSEAAFDTSQTLLDASTGTTYGFELKNGTPVAVVQPKGETKKTRMAPKYAVGSGKIGTTFLFEHMGMFGEMRASYYDRDGKWGWTPGQQDPDPRRPDWGKPLQEPVAAACFLCHSTAVVHDQGRLQPEKSLFNVGCERCHGPGRAHIEAVQRGKAPGPIYSLKDVSAEMIMKLCGECHRAPVNLSEAELAHFKELPRFAAPGLSLSACYQKSNGALSCVSCHNPHQKPSKDLASYDPVCMSCHAPQKPKAVLCPVNQKDRCVSCHMPALPAEFPVPVKFRTHWIKPYPQAQHTD